MQPGYPGSGQDPYSQQPPYSDPYAQPQYHPEAGPVQPPDPYAAPIPPGGYPGYGQYPVAGYGPPPEGPQNNLLGLLGMIFGIVSIPFAVCCGVVGFLPATAGVVLGILGMRKAAAGEAGNRGQALTGVICGGVGIVLTILALVAATVWRLHFLPTR